MQDELYCEEYFATSCGPVPYERCDRWLFFFIQIAENVIRSIRPDRVLDAGCAMGFLVEAFWDRGVYCEGIDISAYAIERVRRDVACYCRVQSLTEPMQDRFDLVTCIEVLEHIPREYAREVIRNLCSVTDTILFSSTPTDLAEPTHVNVQPIKYWLDLFAEQGFEPDVLFDARFISPHAFVVRRGAGCGADLPRLFSEHLRLQIELQSRASALAASQQQLSTANDDLQRAIAKHVELENALRASAGAEQQLSTANDDLQRAIAKHAELENALRAVEESRDRDLAFFRLSQLQGELASARKEIAAASKRTGQLTEDLRIETLRKQRAEAQLQKSERELRESGARLGLAETNMAELQRELFQARAAAQLAETLAHMLQRSRSWRLTQPFRSVTERIRGNAVSSWFACYRRSFRLLQQSGLIDRDWYLERYPDVKARGVDPVLHYFKRGAREGRNPGPEFDTQWYLAVNPDVAARQMNPLAHYIEYGAREGRRPLPVPAHETLALPTSSGAISESADVFPAPSQPVDQLPTAHEVLNLHWAQSAAMPVFWVRDTMRRLSIVTDSINAGSLYGGVGTALLLAAELADRLDVDLRLITRTEYPEIDNIHQLLSLHGLNLKQNLEIFHCPFTAPVPVPISDSDLFLTTSWWTTRSALGSIDPARIVYLLQEDERMFYPFGDDRLRCQETMGAPGINVVVNSETLFQHLTTGRDAIPNLARTGVSFEPAFPESHYYPNPGRSGKSRFFFYARPRPENTRNLYWRGLEAISSALEQGIFNPEEWEFVFAGRCVTPIQLPSGVVPEIRENLPWSEYAALLRTVDVGMSLMETPHSSYPPIDLAASGAIVVTNKHGIKTDLSKYSDNIICANSSVAGLTAALKQAVVLARDHERRKANYRRNRMSRDWKDTLAPAVDHIATIYNRANSNACSA